MSMAAALLWLLPLEGRAECCVTRLLRTEAHLPLEREGVTSLSWSNTRNRHARTPSTPPTSRHAGSCRLRNRRACPCSPIGRPLEYRGGSEGGDHDGRGQRRPAGVV